MCGQKLPGKLYQILQYLINIPQHHSCVLVVINVPSVQGVRTITTRKVRGTPG